MCAACMIRLADTDVVGMYLVRKHDIDYIDALDGRSCTNCRVSMYTIFPCNKYPLAHIEKTIVNSIVSETLLKNMWKDCNVDDVLYVLGNL